MKKKKLNLMDAHATLSKNQMKAITAGSGSGDCQTYKQYCNTSEGYNCCNGENLVCANEQCWHITL